MEKQFIEEKLESLLSGKEVQFGLSSVNLTGTTRLVTDGDINTGMVMKPASHSTDPSAIDTLLYEFSSPQNIDAIKVHIENNNNATYDYFCKDSNNRDCGSGRIELIDNVTNIYFFCLIELQM